MSQENLFHNGSGVVFLHHINMEEVRGRWFIVKLMIKRMKEDNVKIPF